jgi:hypothetical protein
VVRSLLAAALIIASLTPGSEAATWTVWPNGSGNTPTIQSAVDSAAVSGDVIVLRAGNYHEDGIIVDGKSIAITQSGGQAYLILPSAGTGVCFTFRNLAAGTLGDLAFRGFETAIAVEGASPTIQFVTLKACNRGVTIAGASTAKMWFSLADSCATAVEVQGGSVTLQNQTIVNCSTGARFLGGSATFTRTIVAHCETGVQCSGGGASLGCNDFYLNATDYSSCTPGTTDFYTDPKFCYWQSAAGPYWLHVTSPCFTKTNPCVVLVGAFTAPTPGCTGTAVEHMSWGTIKDIYR